jgi:hypothetical protein
LVRWNTVSRYNLDHPVFLSKQVCPKIHPSVEGNKAQLRWLAMLCVERLLAWICACGLLAQRLRRCRARHASPLQSLPIQYRIPTTAWHHHAYCVIARLVRWNTVSR